MIKEKCRGAVDPGGDVTAGCFISGGFAGAPLESAGFLLFFYPQPNSLPRPAPFFLSPPLSPHSTQSPLLTGSSVIWGTTHSSLLSTLLRNIHSLFLILCWDIFLSDLCVLGVTSWQGFFKRWDCEKGEGSQARGGEQLTSVSVLVEEFGNYWTLSSISLSLSLFTSAQTQS